MKGLNLSSFKKMAEDKDSATMIHEDGHKIIISKGALPALQRKQLEKLPICMADGGDVSGDENDYTASAQTASQKASVSPAEAPGQSGVLPTPPQTPSDASQVLPEPSNSLPGQGQEVGIPDQAPITPQKGLDTGYQQGLAGLKEQQGVQTKQAQASLDSDQDQIDAINQLQTAHAQNTQAYNDNQAKFMQDYTAGHINPDHYKQNMTTVQKVATGIGLFLGGFGAAFNGGKNPALDFLNSQIDRDIAAQREDIAAKADRSKTLLAANTAQYHDQILGEQVTTNQLRDIQLAQAKQAADKLGTPMAKAQYDILAGNFKLQNFANQQQIVNRQTVLQAIEANGGKGVTPLQLGNAGLIPQAEAVKEQESYDKQKQAINNVNTLYDQANKEQTAGNLLNPQSYRRIGQINASIRDQVLSTDVNHRLSPDVLNKLIDPYLINTTDSDATRQQKQQGLLQKIKEQTAGNLPYTSQIAPGLVPQYGSPKPSYKVGDILHVRGQKVQITDPQGNYKPVR